MLDPINLPFRSNTKRWVLKTNYVFGKNVEFKIETHRLKGALKHLRGSFKKAAHMHKTGFKPGVSFNNSHIYF